MAKSKDDMKYATLQARHSEDEAVRARYEHDTPLESGKIADSKPVDLFSAAHNVAKAASGDNSSGNQPQMQRPDLMKREGGPESPADSVKFPKKTPPSLRPT